ncbi:protein-L-isoaspartate O-methyltransferase [Cellulomonas sp. PhB143]|uniref:protein-L-isoaspartate O-methyltransferase family protein n=1 Tax=Cellulomonas sp. PhB143 TaxID=2485186 RepID=UPI000F475F56|nr:protein-L-isoaspartate O-methyltransferase [Cellulomonas sp. PhB143]ROS73584.1 protein-L-isoaspartate(D-aspartate) O-methyltransferase [Cellulomonas sp. PhB143]
MPDGPGTSDDAGTPVPGPDRVGDAVRAVDRAAFLPASARSRAGEDHPIDIGFGATCSQPSTVAEMLRLLEVPPGAWALDVGSGSGWTTALLAHLVGPTGEVLGVELVPELVDRSAQALAACETPWASVQQAAPGVLGSPRPGGWDRILVSAAAETLPADLVDQLADGGRMVAPVRHVLVLVERDGEQLRTSEHGTYTFVPLRRP